MVEYEKTSDGWEMSMKALCNSEKLLSWELFTILELDELAFANWIVGKIKVFMRTTDVFIV